jgi:hypothetical protein
MVQIWEEEGVGGNMKRRRRRDEEIGKIERNWKFWEGNGMEMVLGRRGREMLLDGWVMAVAE